MANIYINTTGNDTTGNGTEGNPYLTMAKAYAVLTSGDTVYVASSTSTYTWASISITKSFTVQGTTTNPANHVFDGATGNVAWNITSTSTTVTKKYLTFRRAGMPDREGIFAIHNNSSNCNGSAFYATNCIIHTITCSQTDWGGGIWTQGYQASSNCIIDVRNCLFYNLSRNTSGTVLCIVGAYSSTGINVYLYNNIIYLTTGITYPLIRMFSMAVAQGTLYYKNNIIMDPSLAGTMATTGTGSFSTINKGYNDFYGVVNDGGTGTITSNPLFVDVASSNYNLRPSSPCIDTGVAIT